MVSTDLIVKVSTIRERKFFSVMADDRTDVSNIEELSFCVRSVDYYLDVSEDFIGFYESDNIKSETIGNTIKENSVKVSLKFRRLPWTSV